MCDGCIISFSLDFGSGTSARNRIVLHLLSYKKYLFENEMELLSLVIKVIDTMDLTTFLLFGLFFIMMGYRPPWWFKKLKTHSNTISDIPGPMPLPILGTSWTFTWIGGYTVNKVHEFYKDMFKRYGPVIKEEALWNVPVISIVSKSDIETVLKATGRYPIRPPTEAIAYYRRSKPERYASTGLINEQGESWQHLRTNLTKDITSPQTIANFIPQVNEISDDLCALIKCIRSKDNVVSEFELLSQRLGLEAMCTLVLGRRMGFLLPDGETDIARRLRIAVHHHFLSCRDTYYGLPLWKLMPTRSYSHLIESEDDIYNLALELVATASESTKESVIFESILNAEIDEREKTAAIVDFVASGIYTLGNTLVFLLSLISKRKDIQEKIANEEDSEYIKACIKETFRILPTANCLARVTEKDLELSGYKVKAGSVVVCQTGLACRDASNFSNPDDFVPERWMGDQKPQTLANSTFLLVPFGCGRRMCPGKRFIEQTLPVIFKHLVKNFIISMDTDIDVICEFIMAPVGPVQITFEDRC